MIKLNLPEESPDCRSCDDYWYCGGMDSRCPYRNVNFPPPSGKNNEFSALKSRQIRYNPVLAEGQRIMYPLSYKSSGIIIRVSGVRVPKPPMCRGNVRRMWGHCRYEPVQQPRPSLHGGAYFFFEGGAK